jgi:hypothetical protein
MIGFGLVAAIAKYLEVPAIVPLHPERVQDNQRNNMVMS